jgi:hypothetical protein
MLKLKDFLRRCDFAGSSKVPKLSTDYSRTRGRESLRRQEGDFGIWILPKLSKVFKTPRRQFSREIENSRDSLIIRIGNE